MADWDYSGDLKDYAPGTVLPDSVSTTSLEDYLGSGGVETEEDSSDMVSVRVPSQLTRFLDELVIVAKERGLPTKTRSDLVRGILKWGIAHVADWLGESGSDLQTWVHGQRLAGREALNSSAVSQARSQAVSMILGAKHAVVIGEYEEARKQVVSFLTPIMGQIASSNGYLARVYLRELFNNSVFTDNVLGKIREHLETHGVIDNAEAAHRNQTT